MRLALGGAQEDLITAHGQRIDQCFAGEVVVRTDLTGFEDDAGALVTGTVPVALVVKAAVEERLLQALDLFLAEFVLAGLLRGPLLRLATAGFKSASFPPPWNRWMRACRPSADAAGRSL